MDGSENKHSECNNLDLTNKRTTYSLSFVYVGTRFESLAMYVPVGIAIAIKKLESGHWVIKQNKIKQPRLHKGEIWNKGTGRVTRNEW